MVKKEEYTARKKVLTKAELEQTLINNFVNLQKVLTNMAVKFDDLSNNISKLLQLFEISAKSFTERYSNEDDFGKKIDVLFDQNKTIAKGLMLIEEKLRTRDNYQQSIGARQMSRF